MYETENEFINEMDDAKDSALCDSINTLAMMF
jgi:hypothetical protein